MCFETGRIYNIAENVVEYFFPHAVDNVYKQCVMYVYI